jgi:hypothetical protein
MDESESDDETRLVRNVDEALAQNPALTPEQLEDVRHWRSDLQKFCRRGRTDEAKRCEEVALSIIREGAPVSD